MPLNYCSSYRLFAMGAQYSWQVDHIPNAQKALAEERKRTQSERDAFIAFHEQVAALEPQSSPSTESEKLQRPIRPLPDQPQPNTLEEVREAYQKTVMQTPHYAAEYGDTLAESLTMEFGPELTQVLTNTECLSLIVQQTVLSANQESQDRRDEFLSLLDDEETALNEAAASLKEIGNRVLELDMQSSMKLTNIQNQIKTLENRCDDLAQARQTTIQTAQHGPSSRWFENEEFHQYLYASLDIVHPVLADIAILGEFIQTTRQQLEDVLDSQ